MRGPSPPYRSRRRSVTNAARRCSAKTRLEGEEQNGVPLPCQPAYASLPSHAFAVARACGLGLELRAGFFGTLLDVACEVALDAVAIAQVDVKLIEGDLDAGRAQCLQDGGAQIGLDGAGLGDVGQRDAQGEH